MHIASEAGSFGEGSVHNGYVTETNAGEGARCALIRVSPGQNSKSIVTGPSLIWLIFISAPKIPHLTGTPCSASFSAA